MDTTLRAPVIARPPPDRTAGPLAWLRSNLFADWKNALATLVVVALIARWLPGIIDWALVRAITKPDNAACRSRCCCPR